MACNLVINLRLVGKIGKIKMIDKSQRLVLYIQICPDRPPAFLQLFQSCVRSPVRVYKPVHTEVPVMGEFAGVSAVVVNRLSFFCLTLPGGVVTPFPHKAAGKLIILINHLLVVFNISRAVAHGMHIFTLD